MRRFFRRPKGYGIIALFLCSTLLTINLYGLFQSMAQSIFQGLVGHHKIIQAFEESDKIKLLTNVEPMQKVMNESSKQFIQNEYENAVDEIQYRISDIDKLFLIKFSLVGAILALFITSFLQSIHLNYKNSEKVSSSLTSIAASPIAALFLWIAVITSAIIDGKIQLHRDFIGTLGYWIRIKIEPLFAGNLILDNYTWENFFVSYNSVLKSNWFPFFSMDSQLLTILTFYVTLGLYSIVIPDNNNTTVSICRYGSIVSFLLFFINSVHYGYNDFFWILICMILSGIGIVASLIVWPPMFIHRKNNDLAKENGKQG